MANLKVSAVSPSILPAPATDGPQPDKLHTDSETYSRSILGPSYFTLSELNVAGSSMVPADPRQSQYIVASNETFTVSLKIKFNDSPLTRLLLCLGVDITANFGFEGFGANADEVDVAATIVTQKDVFEYVIEWTGTPEQAQLTAGLYEIGATVTVGPGSNPCAQYIFGYGYIEEVLMQVYPAAY
jgi:hypothetical protein